MTGQKILVLKSAKLKKETSPQKAVATKAGRVQHKGDEELGFKCVYFTNIRASVKDFDKKERERRGFEKALEAIGLKRNTVLKRLREGKTAYEDKAEQDMKCQRAYMKYKKKATRNNHQTGVHSMCDDQSKAERSQTKRSEEEEGLPQR